MTEEEKLNHTYLGDGVYAEHDGYHMILRTGDHRDHLCDNKVYLDDSVMENLIRFMEYLNSRNKTQETQE